MKVDVMLVRGDEATPQDAIRVESNKTHIARQQAHAQLSESYFVRSINVREDRQSLIAYVTEERPTMTRKPKPVGRPVRQTGMVGRNRSIDRRGHKGIKR